MTDAGALSGIWGNSRPVKWNFYAAEIVFVQKEVGGRQSFIVYMYSVVLRISVEFAPQFSFEIENR